LRITTIINQKGGVGKTSTAHALSTGLKHRGFKVLAVDVDPQGNLSYTIDADTSGRGLYEAMCEETPTSELIQTTPQCDTLPSTLLLSAADMEFTNTGREWILDNVLQPVKQHYDYIIIDSPPTLGILTVNALTACNDVIVPMGTDIYSLQGLNQLYATIGKVRKFCNRDITIAGLLLTRYNGRSVLSRDIKSAIEAKAAELNAPLYKTCIREAIAVKESQTSKQSLFDYAPSATATQDYNKFINEYLAQEKGEK